MIDTQHQMNSVLDELYKDARHDHLRMIRGMTRSMFRPMEPKDFKKAYLAISKEQGEFLTQLIIEKGIKNIVEFGTSFGISTLFLAQGALETGGRIVTTELIESKAAKAQENFKEAGVDQLIEVKVGDALDTLKDYKEPIDLLLLDGWKDLYLSLFRLMEPNFHPNTLVYVDNADMGETKTFLGVINQNEKYEIKSHHHGKVALITHKVQ